MSEWISVEDRLPDQGQPVIYWFSLLGVFAGKFERLNGTNLFSGERGFLGDEVTHWMPLPEPPEVQE